MKRECDSIGDAIWEYVRFGVAMSADDQRHIVECPECERILAESRRVQGLMNEAARVPQSPDCTSAVMSRISARQRPVLAYAVTVVMILLIIGSLIALRPHNVTPQIVRDNRKPEITAPAIKETVSEPEEVIPKVVKEREVAVAERPIRHRSIRRSHPIVPKQTVPRDELPVPEQVAEEPRPIVAVSVTWGAEPTESSSYAYTDTDEATGETTTCSVVASPDNVSIIMKSTPGGEEPPTKGA